MSEWKILKHLKRDLVEAVSFFYFDSSYIDSEINTMGRLWHGILLNLLWYLIHFEMFDAHTSKNK